MQQSSTTDKAVICSKYRAAVELSGRSAMQIAAEADISYRTLYGIIRGDGHPRGRTLSKIARVLGTTTHEIMNDLYDGNPKLKNVTRDMRAAYGDDALPPGVSILARRGDPTPVPAQKREIRDLITMICDVLRVEEMVAIEHIQQMVMTREAGKQKEDRK